MSSTNSIYIRDKLICVYCGFRGNSFEKWMQLSIDHIKPLQHGGTDDDSNLTVCCHSCNSITSKYQPTDNATVDKMIVEKRKLVFNHRETVLNNWLKQIT
jgi:5-methylcytosine-specific restriction endonuclease McrA